MSSPADHSTTFLHSRAKLVEAVLLDLPLGVQAELLLDADLDPQPLAVEAVLVALVEAAERLVALEDVLQRAAPGRVHARASCSPSPGRRRSSRSGPPRLCSRTRSNVLSRSHSSRISCSSAGWSGHGRQRLEVRLRPCGDCRAGNPPADPRVNAYDRRGTTLPDASEENERNREWRHVTESTFEQEVLQSETPGRRRLLGGVVRAVPRRRAGARQDRVRARGRAQAS